MSFSWDIFWWFFCAYAFFAYLFALFSVIGDLFRDDRLSGWWKAIWILLLAFLPILTVLAYMVARGGGMAERSRERSRIRQESADAYIRRVATASPSEEISKAKALMDSGSITADEFEKIKSRILA